MSSAAAVARKTVQSAGDPISSEIPEFFKKLGYTATPNVFFDRLPRLLTGTELAIVGKIHRESIGGKGRPEWAPISEKMFVDVAPSGTSESVRQCLRKLEKLEMVESRDSVRGKGRGKFREYRIPQAFWERARVMSLRDRREIEEREIVAWRGERIQIEPGRQWSMELKTPPTELVVEGTISAAIVPSGSGGVLRLKIEAVEAADAKPAPGPELVSRPRPVSPRLPIDANSPSGVGVSDEKRPGELRNFLQPIFLRRFESPIDADVLAKIDHALGGADVLAFRRVVEAKLRQGRAEMYPMLFVKFAEDALEGFRERQRLAPKPEPVPAVVNIAEPEDSGSEWSRIRAKLRTDHVQKPEYDNWFLNTAQKSFADGTLSVQCGMEIEAEFLGGYYSAAVQAAALAIGIKLDRVVFLIAEQAQ